MQCLSHDCFCIGRPATDNPTVSCTRKLSSHVMWTLRSSSVPTVARSAQQRRACRRASHATRPLTLPTSAPCHPESPSSINSSKCSGRAGDSSTHNHAAEELHAVVLQLAAHTQRATLLQDGAAGSLLQQLAAGDAGGVTRYAGERMVRPQPPAARHARLKP
jgi:hypothetical protein